jgi:hypothetical protein
MEYALKVNGLSKQYPGLTLSDVPFGFERGTVIYLFVLFLYYAIIIATKKNCNRIHSIREKEL